MEIQLLDDGDTIKASGFKEFLKEQVEKDFSRRFTSYDFENTIKSKVAEEFLRQHGKSILKELKDKLLTEWAETFKSEVLQRALSDVMKGNPRY